jgi:hypothetical protein
MTRTSARRPIVAGADRIIVRDRSARALLTDAQLIVVGSRGRGVAAGRGPSWVGQALRYQVAVFQRETRSP